MNAEEITQRIDKWLWVARFYKTRGEASAAICAGHVKLNGTSVKAARLLRIGDSLEIKKSGGLRFVVQVHHFCAQRRPTSEASALYSESGESKKARLAQQEMFKNAPNPHQTMRGRPSKRDRRKIHAFNESLS